MRKGFEVNGDYRLMDSSELVYILTNSAVMVNKVQEKEVVYGEECSFEDVLAKMTPGKRNLVMAGVELYKRCNSNKNQRPVIRQSTDIYDYMQPVLGDNKTEECWAILMNSSARVIKRIRLFRKARMFRHSSTPDYLNSKQRGKNLNRKTIST